MEKDPAPLFSIIIKIIIMKLAFFVGEASLGARPVEEAQIGETIGYMGELVQVVHIAPDTPKNQALTAHVLREMRRAKMSFSDRRKGWEQIGKVFPKYGDQ